MADAGPQTLAEALELLREREVELTRAAVDLGRARQDLEETRRAEARLSAVVQSSNDAIISMTPDCAIQTWSPGASRMLRYDQSQIAGEHIQALMRSSARDSFGKALQQNLSGYNPQPYESQWRRADGSLVDVAVTVFALYADTGDIKHARTLRCIERNVRAVIGSSPYRPEQSK